MQNLPSNQPTNSSGSDLQKTESEKKWSLTKFSVGAVIESNENSLIKIGHDNGIEIAFRVVRKHVKAFLDFLGQELSESAINDIAEIIITNYGHYSDMVLKEAFLRIKSGRYTKEFGKITGLMITEMFSQFDLEYGLEIAEYRERETHNAKNNTPNIEFILNPVTDDDRKQNAYAMMRQDLDKIGKQQEKPIYEPIKIDAPACIIQEWIREFDDLFKKSGRPIGIKSVEVDGKRMTQLDFLEYKRKMFDQLSE